MTWCPAFWDSHSEDKEHLSPMIKIVTDSVASLPADLASADGVEVVSLYLNENGYEHEDATMDVDDFYSRIYDMADNPPKSSQPSQSLLEELFESIAQAGDELLGIWISSSLSGAFDGALRAARAVESRNIDFSYVMIDSQSCGWDEALPVLDGVSAVRGGATLAEAAQAVLHAIASTRFLFTPESLTFLQKGGRIGGAAALVGNLIRLCPVLTVVDGIPQSMAKVRTRKKALEKIVAIMQEDIARAGGLKDLAVHYIGDKAPAVEWAHKVIEPLFGRKVRVLPVSPVVGLHVGPAVGVAYECVHPLEGKITGDLNRLAFSS